MVPTWRRLVSRALVILFSVLAVLSLVAVWTYNELLDTDAYVNTVSSLAADPDIQQALAAQISDRLVDRMVATPAVDAESGSGVSLSGITRLASIQVIDRTVEAAIESPQFLRIWEDTNRLAHPYVVNLLRGNDSGVLQVREGDVMVDLAPLFVLVQDQLRSAGISFGDRVSFTPAETTIVLFRSSELAEIQWWVDLLVTLRFVLPVLTVACLAGYLVLSRNRMHAVVWSGVGLAVAMTLFVVALAIARRAYLGGIDPGLDRAAVTAFVDIVIRDLRGTARALVLAGLVVAGLAHVLDRGNAYRATIDRVVARHRTGLLAMTVATSCVAIVATDEIPLDTILAVIVIAATICGAVIWISRHAVEPAPEPAAP